MYCKQKSSIRAGDVTTFCFGHFSGISFTQTLQLLRFLKFSWILAREKGDFDFIFFIMYQQLGTSCAKLIFNSVIKALEYKLTQHFKKRFRNNSSPLPTSGGITLSDLEASIKLFSNFLDASRGFVASIFETEVYFSLLKGNK